MQMIWGQQWKLEAMGHVQTFGDLLNVQQVIHTHIQKELERIPIP